MAPAGQENPPPLSTRIGFGDACNSTGTSNWNQQPVERTQPPNLTRLANSSSLVSHFAGGGYNHSSAHPSAHHEVVTWMKHMWGFPVPGSEKNTHTHTHQSPWLIITQFHNSNGHKCGCNHFCWGTSNSGIWYHNDKALHHLKIKSLLSS